MQTLRFTALIFALFSSAVQARDHVPSEKKNALSTLEYNTADQTIMSGSQQYAPSVVGLRQYLNQEVAPGSRDYDRLHSRLEELEKQDQFAFRTAMIPVGLGAGSLLVGSLLRQDEEPADARLKSVHEKGGRLMLYGLGGMALGFIVHNILAPDDQDIRQFIQFHNGQASQSTRQDKGANLSLDLLSPDSVVALSYRF